MTEMFGLPSEAIERMCRVFSRHAGIDSVIVYGSRAKGNYRPGSDIDLTIMGQRLELSQLLAIEGEIDDLLLPWMVDLSLFHHIDNPGLIDHIRRVGQPIYTGKMASK